MTMPTLAAGAASAFQIDLLIVLTTAAIVGMALRRLRLAIIPGYLLAGALVGPGFLSLVHDPDSTQAISNLAVVLLMFTIGLHLSRDELRGGLLPILGVGVLSTMATIVFLTPAGMVFGLGLPEALALAAAMSMSSTAVVLRLLQQRRELKTAHGRIAFGTLLTQDIIVVLVIASLPVLASWSGVAPESDASSPTTLGVLSGLLVAVGAVGVFIVGGALLMPRLMGEAAKDPTGELLLVLTAAIGLGAAVLTGAIGFSPELGALIAGILIAATPFRHELTGQLNPLRDLFMAVFFTAVGMQLDLMAVGPSWWAIPVGLVVVVVVKLLTIGGSAWVFGAPPIVAGATGVALAQAGEFSLVVIFAAKSAGMFADPAVGAVIIAIVVLSLIVTPTMIDYGRRFAVYVRPLPIAPWAFKGSRRVGMVDESPAGGLDAVKKTRVVVAGYGPVGRTLADRFTKLGAEVRVIELNAVTVRRQTHTGQATIFGDAANPIVLEQAGIEEADAAILTMPDEEATIRAIQAIRMRNPGAFIAARTTYLSRSFMMREAGADHVTVEELVTANAMQEQVIEAFEARRRGADVGDQAARATRRASTDARSA